MSENGSSPNGLSAIARLKLTNAERSIPQPLEIAGHTYYFRRLNGLELDHLVTLQAEHPNLSTARYNAELVSLAFVSDTDTPLTVQDVLSLGPWFYDPAMEFVFRITRDYRVDEAAEKAAEPDAAPLSPVTDKRSSRRGVL
jgi:hypothetical protein